MSSPKRTPAPAASSARPATADPAPSPPSPEPVLARAMRPVNYVVERFIPSALIFAIVLTTVVGVMALLLTDAGPVTVVEDWGKGLSGLLEFMTQMALVVLLLLGQR